MADKPMCLVCKEEMKPGFILERGDYVLVHEPRWCAGVARPGVRGEAQIDQIAASLRIVAYRCPKCEALRLYAPSRG